MKDRIATYIVNGVDLNAKDKRLVRHERGCRYLEPTTDRPHVGVRKARKKDMTKHRECKIC